MEIKALCQTLSKAFDMSKATFTRSGASSARQRRVRRCRDADDCESAHDASSKRTTLQHQMPVSGKMSSEEEDVFLCYVNKYRKRKRAKRRFWVHPYLKINNDKRLFIAAKQMTESDDKFRSFYRMSKATFNELLQIVAPLIQKQNTNMRECVSPEERIMITLR